MMSDSPKCDIGQESSQDDSPGKYCSSLMSTFPMLCDSSLLDSVTDPTRHLQIKQSRLLLSAAAGHNVMLLMFTQNCQFVLHYTAHSLLKLYKSCISFRQECVRREVKP